MTRVCVCLQQTRHVTYTLNTVLLARISLRCLEINAFQIPFGFGHTQGPNIYVPLVLFIRNKENVFMSIVGESESETMIMIIYMVCEDRASVQFFEQLSTQM